MITRDILFQFTSNAKGTLSTFKARHKLTGLIKPILRRISAQQSVSLADMHFIRVNFSEGSEDLKKDILHTLKGSPNELTPEGVFLNPQTEQVFEMQVREWLRERA